jgi:hypothetical protein
MVLLSEWNDGAVALILLLFLIPVVIIFFISLFLVRLSPKTKYFIDSTKKEKPVLYFVILALFFGLSAFIVYCFFNFK